MQVNKPHPNAEIIKAWADGKAIQFHDGYGWADFGNNGRLNGPWLTTVGIKWRVKPEPKPDVIMYGYVDMSGVYNLSVLPERLGSNLKLIFDGETGDLKSAEVI